MTLLAGIICSSTGARAAPESTAQGFRHASTLRSVGFEWDLTGDDDHDAEE